MQKYSNIEKSGKNPIANDRVRVRAHLETDRRRRRKEKKTIEMIGTSHTLWKLPLLNGGTRRKWRRNHLCLHNDMKIDRSICIFEFESVSAQPIGTKKKNTSYKLNTNLFIGNILIDFSHDLRISSSFKNHTHFDYLCGIKKESSHCVRMNDNRCEGFGYFCGGQYEVWMLANTLTVNRWIFWACPHLRRRLCQSNSVKQSEQCVRQSKQMPIVVYGCLCHLCIDRLI